MKVIQIVESLDAGAVENWLVRMFAYGRAARQDKLDWTFYCLLGRPGRLDEQVRALGGKIVTAKALLSRPAAFVRALRQELRTGQYEVMHGHHDIMNGLYMAASAGLPIRRRVVHAHNADENVPTSNALKAAAMRPVLRRFGLCADRVVGISNHTLDTFLAGRPRRPGRDLVHYYGIDTSPFLSERSVGRERFRRDLNLPPDAVIVLFGGRITPEKNPAMVVDVLARMRRTHPDVYAVFAGAGSLEQEVLLRAKTLGVDHAVRMLGWRGDMAQIMGASDLFILPRPEAPLEGFGIAVVEAQLAGLRMLLSHGVPNDPLLPTAQYRRLALAEGPAAWAEAATGLLAEPSPDRDRARAALAASPMDMAAAYHGLLGLYA